MSVDQTRCVTMGASTLRVARRCTAKIVPMTSAAMTSATLNVTAVTHTYTMVVPKMADRGRQGGVERTAKEQLFTDSVHERDREHDAVDPASARARTLSSAPDRTGRCCATKYAPKKERAPRPPPASAEVTTTDCLRAPAVESGSDPRAARR